MKEGFISIGGIVTALLASACCIGPALFLAFGITGLGFLSVFEGLRSYMLGVTFILVGISYRYAYGKGANCGPDGACTPGARMINRGLFWTLVAFALFGVSFPYVGAWFLA